MKDCTLYGKVVLEDRVVEDGAVSVSCGKIVFAGNRSDLPEVIGEEKDYTGKLILPGFVDIHCHSGDNIDSHVDPVKMGAFHLAHGTTSLLCTIYRGFTQAEYIEYLENVKAAMSVQKNIKGAHFEGPYLNPKYGAGATEEPDEVKRENYVKLAEYGIIKQWTFAPEVEGTDEFLDYISKAGIVPAIGHSKASPEQVYYAASHGAKLVTHLFDATGTSVSPTSYDGTIEVSFDCAALLCDNLYYEIICDKNGVHVRPDMLLLAVKTVGKDRIIGITDNCGGDDTSDINIVDGELYGSNLTMEKVARNLRAIGFSVTEVAKMTATTAADLIGLGTTGRIAPGYDADIVVTEDDYSVIEVMTAY